MKAVICDKYGPPEVQVVTQVDKPQVKEHEILVEVHATTVNRTDTGFRSARYVISRLFSGILRPRYKVFGSEFAGVVKSVGSGITDFAIGDKVFGFDDLKCGCHAEFKVMAASGAVTTMPINFGFEDAAPMAEGAQYALNYIKAKNIKSGDKVLVYGASGGIGSAAVQILKHMGVYVTAVAGTENMEVVKSLGADEVIDYQKENFTDTDKKYDLVLDAVGKSSYAQCKKLLNQNGTYCSTELGPMAQNPFLALWFKFIGSKRVLFPIPRSSKENVEYLKNLAENNAYKPVIDRIYGIDDIVKATHYVESGQKVGNVVIKVR